MVYRVYVEKRPGFQLEAASLLKELRSFLGIEALTDLRLFNRYDVENASEANFQNAIATIFSEPQLDQVYKHLPEMPDTVVFSTEYLPGQFDQRADSAAQCLQLAFECERPDVRTARVFMLFGNLTKAEIEQIKAYVINPVESREAALDCVETLKIPFDIPTSVETLDGFINLSENGLANFIKQYALAMDQADIAFCQAYFQKEGRNPTLTEIRMIDTYWSDHCRHTTFLTELRNVEFEDANIKAAYERYLALRTETNARKPICLMDVATIGAKALKMRNLLPDIDESEEINACTIKIEVDVDGKSEPWLLLFKNETHNHPTEIEPFGGAATCIGGAIRDPLSGRSYVYQAMRVTGASDPTAPLKETIPGKLPQKKLVTTAAAGYSSYGNQIGLATGIVDEIYHSGYAAKRMEIGAVIGAAPAANVRREEPSPGDVILLLGGRTGRDGCGGATGSSKAHQLTSLTECGAEVQKGNAPEERKLQRLFKNPDATLLIKRCNDFGAGGVSVAIGELADGLTINLNAVPKKYEGLDGTELAISESQERMAVALTPSDVNTFIALAHQENLEATPVAVVTEEKRLKMDWNGNTIVDISREFLNSNGAPKSTDVLVTASKASVCSKDASDFVSRMKTLAKDLNNCSKRGLSERFDSTIGGASVLMPFGGARQRTPAQVMVAKLPVASGKTETCSAMAFGFNPFLSEKSPYQGAYLAVVESLAKLVASGAGLVHAHLTFQEYFPRTKDDPSRWGLPLAALLGALDAQLDFSIASIGGKDSMSGSFENLDVPPTLVSFAVSTCNVNGIISPEFKRIGSPVVLLKPTLNERGLPDSESMKVLFAEVSRLIADRKVLSCATLGMGGVASTLAKMGMGNAIGLKLSESIELEALFETCTGAFVLELSESMDIGIPLGETTEKYQISAFGKVLDMLEWESYFEGKLEDVFPCNPASNKDEQEQVTYTQGTPVASRLKLAKPRVLIPAFPGTNCEMDTARAFEQAGAIPEVLVVQNLSASDVKESVEKFSKLVEQAQIVFLPGGFSGGDEPDGSAKFITAFLRNPCIADKLLSLLNMRDGLIGGICNGFQALIKLGLVPFGDIRDATSDAPTLTFNLIGRHQSRLVRTRVCSNLSPWLMGAQVGDIHLTPISHGEGRFVCSAALFQKLAAQGQISTQYVDELGHPSMHIDVNPNGSMYCVEGITSPDGRVFGRMAHSERNDQGLYVNVPGNKDNSMFRSAVEYFTR